MSELDKLDRHYSAATPVTQFQDVLDKVVGGPAIAGRQFADGLMTDQFEGTQWMIRCIDEVEARRRLVNCGYALAEYRAVYGEYPEAIDALVPDFLESVPLDPFSGAPLRYRRVERQFVFYSVGGNEIDDGGIDIGTGQTIGVPGDDLNFGIVAEVRNE